MSSVWPPTGSPILGSPARSLEGQPLYLSSSMCVVSSFTDSPRVSHGGTLRNGHFHFCYSWCIVSWLFCEKSFDFSPSSFPFLFSADPQFFFQRVTYNPFLSFLLHLRGGHGSPSSWCFWKAGSLGLCSHPTKSTPFLAYSSVSFDTYAQSHVTTTSQIQKCPSPTPPRLCSPSPLPTSGNRPSDHS